MNYFLRLPEDSVLHSKIFRSLNFLDLLAVFSSGVMMQDLVTVYIVNGMCYFHLPTLSQPVLPENAHLLWWTVLRGARHLKYVQLHELGGGKLASLVENEALEEFLHHNVYLVSFQCSSKVAKRLYQTQVMKILAKSCPRLRTFHLTYDDRGVSVKDGNATEVASVVSLLQNFLHFKSTDLVHLGLCNLPRSCTQGIKLHISRCQNLKSLSLPNCQLDLSFISLLRHCIQLESIDLRDNVGVTSTCARFLMMSLPQLKQLQCAGTGIGQSAVEQLKQRGIITDRELSSTNPNVDTTGLVMPM